jgi:hypothetical protein
MLGLVIPFWVAVHRAVFNWQLSSLSDLFQSEDLNRRLMSRELSVRWFNAAVKSAFDRAG